MEQDFQTAFIPKKPLTEERTEAPRTVNVFSLVATIIFIASLASAGGAFFYKFYLGKSVEAETASLNRAKAAFEPTLIIEMKTLDRRITSANEILNNHITVSPILKSLQSLTLKSIQFTKFDYAVDPATKNINIKLSGVTSPAGSYTSIALQSDKLGENKYFQDPVFSNLNLNEKGGVTFDLSFTVDKSFLLYADNLNKS
jgi:hypothetical protein